MSEKPKLLLHSCCGPCSTAVIERLAEKWRMTVFFYNPNLTDRAEYEKRLAAQQQFVDAWNRRLPGVEDEIRVIEGAYEPERFFAVARGKETEPEGGLRCRECFRLRLEETATRAVKGGFDRFATTLSVSPHKDAPVIARVGEEAANEFGATFVSDDFKKQGGYRRSIELSKAYQLYRQNYCGCLFSKMAGDSARGAVKGDPT